MSTSPFSRQAIFIGAACLALTALASLGAVEWYGAHQEDSPKNFVGDNRVPEAFPQGPPWLYGHADARFTLTLYADLECPFCKTYFPILKSWVDNHPDMLLEWSHLPLSIHEPAATELAVLAECAGEAGGQSAFWDATTWIYRHTRSDGRGLPPGVSYPGVTAAINVCTSGDQPKSIVSAQMQEAAAKNIDATPTVMLHDNETGKSLLLPGPVDGDTLLSALDLIAAGNMAMPGQHEMPADLVGKPR
ncbi:MAG: thioredoxin domain-containing protein [Shinella sp.]|nr:thioredoxin domain-containing protein [Shinella sp.]